MNKKASHGFVLLSFKLKKRSGKISNFREGTTERNIKLRNYPSIEKSIESSFILSRLCSLKRLNLNEIVVCEDLTAQKEKSTMPFLTFVNISKVSKSHGEREVWRNWLFFTELIYMTINFSRSIKKSCFNYQYQIRVSWPRILLKPRVCLFAKSYEVSALEIRLYFWKYITSLYTNFQICWL